MSAILDLRNQRLSEVNFNDYDSYKVFHLENNNIEEPLIIEDKPNITNLYLCHNKLEGTLILKNLENILIVMVNNNNLSKVIIDNCPKLMFLNVINNKNLEDVVLIDCPNIQIVDRNPYHLLPSIESLLDKLDAQNLRELDVNLYNIKFCYDELNELSLIVIKHKNTNENETFKITRDKIEKKTFNEFKMVWDYDDEFSLMYEDMCMIKFNKNPLGLWKSYRFIKDK